MNRSMIATGLFLGALTWVGLLSLTSGSRPAATAAGPQPGSPSTGAAKAAIQFIDLSRFAERDPSTGDSGEVSLRLAIHDDAGKPINDLRKEDFQVTEGELPGRIKSFRGPASQAVNVILVLDVSGSMIAAGRIQGAKLAARAALDTLKSGRDRVGLIAFDHAVDVRHEFGPLTEEARHRCEAEIERMHPRGGTSIGPPAIRAIDMFREQKPDGLKMVLVMTDGDDGDRSDFRRLRQRIGELSESAGVQVHSISVGDEVSQSGADDLRDLAAKGKGQYEHSPSAARLAELFRTRVAESISECSLVYDSPYPQADGFPRRVRVMIKAPGRPLVADGEYKVGSNLSARSKPAAWVAAQAGSSVAPTAAGSTTGNALPITLFLGLFAALTAALLAPGWMRKAGPGKDEPPAPAPTAAAVRTGPAPPPPPPIAPQRATTAAHSSTSVRPAAPQASAPSRPAPPPPPPPVVKQQPPAPSGESVRPPAAGGVIKPPPPPPPPPPKRQ